MQDGSGYLAAPDGDGAIPGGGGARAETASRFRAETAARAASGRRRRVRLLNLLAK